MKAFKFLNGNFYELNGIQLRNEIIESAFELCNRYNRYVEFCQNEYLRGHPNLNPNSIFSFPIPHNRIEKEFDEGLLWHGGSDYYEEDDRVSHYVHLDVVGEGEEDDYFIEINEDGFGGFYIHTIGRDRTRWE